MNNTTLQQVDSINELLEQKVRERTAELTEANRDLEAFAYTVAHDLQGPLRAINGFSAVLMKEYKHCLNEDGFELVTNINVNVKRMCTMIQDLLHFSKIEKAIPEMREVNMNELVSSVITELKHNNPQFKAEVKLSDLVSTSCDPGLIKHVWINLIENALKYSSKKEVPVVEIGMHVANIKPVVYFVKDNGTGFDMNYSKKLFTAFQRMHSSDEFEGNGVGLATVHRIITKHGGRIWAEARPHEGASFYFTLSEN